MRVPVLIACLACAGALPPAMADTENVARASEVLDFSVGRRAPAVAEAGLGALDLDGDGEVSRAEAAGNADVTLGFDRADRNRDGRVSAVEWQRYERWQERRARAAAGATAPKKKPRAR